MNYEINISKNGKHYFATASRSLTRKDEALEMYEHFKSIFKKEEGYEIQITRVMHTGELIATTK